MIAATAGPNIKWEAQISNGGQGTPVPARTVARKFLIRGLCVSVGGLKVCAGGLDTLNIDEISTDL